MRLSSSTATTAAAAAVNSARMRGLRSASARVTAAGLPKRAGRRREVRARARERRILGGGRGGLLPASPNLARFPPPHYRPLVRCLDPSRP